MWLVRVFYMTWLVIMTYITWRDVTLSHDYDSSMSHLWHDSLIWRMDTPICDVTLALFYRALLQKRPIILRGLLIVATWIPHMWRDVGTWLYDSSMSHTRHDSLIWRMDTPICDVTLAHDHKTQLYHIYDMTREYDAYVFTYVTWLVHMSICLIYMTWLIHVTHIDHIWGGYSQLDR